MNFHYIVFVSLENKCKKRLIVIYRYSFRPKVCLQLCKHRGTFPSELFMT